MRIRKVVLRSKDSLPRFYSKVLKMHGGTSTSLFKVSSVNLQLNVATVQQTIMHSQARNHSFKTVQTTTHTYLAVSPGLLDIARPGFVVVGVVVVVVMVDVKLIVAEIVVVNEGGVA